MPVEPVCMPIVSVLPCIVVPCIVVLVVLDV
jgi:hypothetical protein